MNQKEREVSLALAILLSFAAIGFIINYTPLLIHRMEVKLPLKLKQTTIKVPVFQIDTNTWVIPSERHPLKSYRRVIMDTTVFIQGSLDGMTWLNHPVMDTIEISKIAKTNLWQIKTK